MSGPQMWLCLFTFGPIASKQLNGLTTIDTLGWPDGAVVTALGASGPGFNPWIRQGFYVSFVALLLLCFYIFCQKKHIICHKSLQFLLQC